MFSANPESCYLPPFEAFHTCWVQTGLDASLPTSPFPALVIISPEWAQLLNTSCYEGLVVALPSGFPARSHIRAALSCAYWGWCVQEDSGGCRGSLRCEEQCNAVRCPKNRLWLLIWWGVGWQQNWERSSPRAPPNPAGSCPRSVRVPQYTNMSQFFSD